MGRPKGSRNKVRDFDVSPAPYTGPDAYRSLPPFPPAAPEAKPDPVTIPLTDEDLEPVRNSKAKHDRAAAKYRRDEIQAELRRKEIGEVEELSVPQVVAFDMSAAFYRVAQQKARAAGYRFAHNLRKTPEGWVFNASNFPKVKHAPEADLS